MKKLALVLAVTLVASSAQAGKRDALVKDFLAYLAKEKIACTVVEQNDDTLVLAVGEAQPTIALDNLEGYIAQGVAAGTPEAEARALIFKKYGDALRDMAKPKTPLSVKADGPFLLPRLVAGDYLAAMPKPVLHQPLGKTGLHVTWVRDGEGSVRYLTPEDLKALGIKQAELDALARKNLLAKTSPEQLRGALGAVVGVARGDSFDAARLLLVPGLLKKGEALHAAVPHRDLLILGPLPPGGDWAPVRAAAKSAYDGSQPGITRLLDRPLLVTADGFELK